MLGLSLPVSLSPLRSGQHGPGLVGTGRCPCMSPTAEPRQLPRYPSPLPCPAPSPGAGFQSSSTGLSQAGLVPKCQAGAAAEGPGGGGLGGDPTAPGSAPGLLPLLPSPPAPPLSGLRTAGFAPPFFPSPPCASAPGSGDPRPRSFARPVSACGQRGPCQSCLNPPTLLLHPPRPPPLTPGVPGRWDTRGQRWVGARGARCM